MKKQDYIQIRVTPLQKEAIRRLAQQYEMTVTELIIKAVTIYGSEREKEAI